MKFSYGLNDKEFKNNLFNIDNTNLGIFEQFKGKKHEKNELGKTDTKTFIKRKRKHKRLYSGINNNLDEDNLKEKENEEINIKENTKRGRRKKNVNKPAYGKFREDNIIQKIKTFIFDYIRDHLNKSLKFEFNNFYPLSKELYSNLKKDFNEKLLESTIYDIYMNSDLNKRYINIPDSNRMLIKKIYKEKVEKDTINILKKKFKDILDYIRKKDLDNFLKDFRLREMKKDDKLIDSYMIAVENMLFKYEFWFKVKLTRNVGKNKKE